MNGIIRELREQQALSLDDMAERTGLSRVTINRVENGKQKPRPGTIRRIAKALGIDVQYITSKQSRLL